MKHIIEILKCSSDDIPILAKLNEQLIEDERSNNHMSIDELEHRFSEFLSEEYDAYFFTEEGNVIGYALVKRNSVPLYLRQFFIKCGYRRQGYGTAAFKILLEQLDVTAIDLEVLPWNEAGMKFWEKCGFKEISRYMRYDKEI